ncbi:MAG: hypothetical protein AAFO74_02695 [Pseudomonadota bacterium]
MPEHSALIPVATDAAPVYLLRTEDWQSDLDLPADLIALAKAQKFKGAAGQMVLSAAPDGTVSGVLFGVGQGTDALAVAALSAKLPAGDYQIVRAADYTPAQLAAAWADGFERGSRWHGFGRFVWRWSRHRRAGGRCAFSKASSRRLSDRARGGLHARAIGCGLGGWRLPV